LITFKFIPEEWGIISITTEKLKRNSYAIRVKELVIITVKDSGSGIDTEILPRLFTKFSSKSFQGKDWVIYLQKNNSSSWWRIWAENEKDRNGSIYYFLH
jgi:hypothetical protein